VRIDRCANHTLPDLAHFLLDEQPHANHLEPSARGTGAGADEAQEKERQKHDMTMAQLYDRRGQDRLRRVSPKEIIEHDRPFFADQGEAHGSEVISLDRTQRAAIFAAETGLIDRGSAGSWIPPKGSTPKGAPTTIARIGRSEGSGWPSGRPLRQEPGSSL